MEAPNSQTIYVFLLDEGVEVWRPVQATALGNNVYRIISEDPGPDTEQWEYTTGDTVRCEERMLRGSLGPHRVLVAVEKA